MEDPKSAPDLHAEAGQQHGEASHPEKQHRAQRQFEHEDVSIIPASVADADAIKQLVTAAYTKYVDRIGREPAPMTIDYRAALADPDPSRRTYALRRRADDRVVGALQLSGLHHGHPAVDSPLAVDNIVVAHDAQGRGYGRLLMDFAEDIARGQGRPALVLHTNEKMHENIVLYGKMGFVEVDRRVQDGYRRVFFRKPLGPLL